MSSIHCKKFITGCLIFISSAAFAVSDPVPQFLENTLNCNGVMFNISKDDENKLNETLSLILGKKWEDSWALVKKENIIRTDIVSYKRGRLLI